MHREYDVFKRVNEKSSQWLFSIHGLFEACERLKLEAGKTTAEVFVQHVKSGQLMARVNIAPADRPRALFFIDYDREHAAGAFAGLMNLGFTMTTHYQSDTARVVLGLPQGYDFFILGHGAPDAERSELCEFIRERCPAALVLALNAQAIRLACADLNISAAAPPGQWISLLQQTWNARTHKRDGQVRRRSAS